MGTEPFTPRRFLHTGWHACSDRNTGSEPLGERLRLADQTLHRCGLQCRHVPGSVSWARPARRGHPACGDSLLALPDETAWPCVCGNAHGRRRHCRSGAHHRCVALGAIRNRNIPNQGWRGRIPEALRSCIRSQGCGGCSEVQVRRSLKLAWRKPIDRSAGIHAAHQHQGRANFEWNPTPPPKTPNPVAPTAPSSGWTTNWQSSLSLSGSGIEALGQTDVRAAVFTIAVMPDQAQAQLSADHTVAREPMDDIELARMIDFILTRASNQSSRSLTVATNV